MISTEFRRTLVFSFLVLLPCVAFAATEKRLTPRDDVQKLGIAAYSAITLAWEGGAVTLFDNRGHDVGRVLTTRSFDGKRMIAIDRRDPAEHLIAYWSGSHLELNFGDGLIRPLSIDLDTAAPEGDRQTVDLFETHRVSLLLAAAVADDLLSRLPKRQIIPALPIQGGEYWWNGPVDWTIDQFWVTWYYPWWDDGYGTYIPRQVGCVGPTVRGWAVADLSRSAICAAARSDANYKCSNQYCLGCCELLECDAVCFVGDYLCASAGVTGTSCGLY